MRKLTALLICIIGIMTLTGCGAGDVGGPGYNPSSSIDESSEPTEPNFEAEMGQYEDNLDGLVKYMKAAGCIEGEPTTMAASIIGAKAGYRFSFIYEKANVSVELYEYDLDNLNDRAKEILTGVKENSKIVINKNEIDAMVNDTGKYLMMYNCSKKNDANIEKESETRFKFRIFKMEGLEDNNNGEVVSQ